MEGASELERALEGKDPQAVRCPECEFRHPKEVEPGVWECPRCGQVAKPRAQVDIDCPHCGHSSIEIDWKAEQIECVNCGVIDNADF